MMTEIFKVKIDFKALDKWRDKDRDDLPITGYISLYKALGIVDAAHKYKDNDHPDFEVIPLDNIFCNLDTHKKIKNFIEHNWQVFSINIDADEHITWDTKKYPKGTRHYAKKLNAAPRNALIYDFSNYAPGLDNNLADDEIVLGILSPDPEESEEA